MIPKRLSRRTLLRGAGGIALALPLLEAMEVRAEVPQKRFLAVFTPNGTVHSHWTPTGTEADFALSPILAPLSPYQSDLVVLADLDNAAADNQAGPGAPHLRGIGSWLTGTELVMSPYATGGGISVDQRLAQVLGTGTRFPSVNLGVLARGADTKSRMSYSAPGIPVPPQSDPRLAANTLFSGLAADPAAAETARARRKSVLDAVLDEFRGLQSRVSASDRRRLDAHATAIRDIELRVTRVTTQAADCKPPTVDPTLDPKDAEHYEDLSKLQTDILVMALQCDLTRVATLQYSEGASAVTFDFLGQTTVQHMLGHTFADSPSIEAQLLDTYVWYSERVAYLLERLKAAQDGPGTLLDHSLVLWGNEMGRPDVHSMTSIPFVLAGRAAGALQTGRFLQFDHVPHNALLVSCLQLMGAPDVTFGNPDYGSGPLAGL